MGAPDEANNYISHVIFFLSLGQVLAEQGRCHQDLIVSYDLAHLEYN